MDPWGLLESLERPVCLVGNDQKHQLADIALGSHECLEIYVGDIDSQRAIAPFILSRPMGRTRAYLKIQDGCNAFCSYCVVPYVRGRSRSLPPDLVFEQVDVMAGNSVREIIVTGIHVGQYGLDLEKPFPLPALLAALCRRHPDIRFRLRSIEPHEITEELLKWAADTPNFCPHWHVPLQSGSDAILKAMNRRYTASEYRERIFTIRSLFPDAAIGADALVGFPGEGPEEFQATLRLLEELPVTYVHAFPYSKRPGTASFGIRETVTNREKAGRVRKLRGIGGEKRLAFYKSQTDMVRPCLIEERDRKSGMPRGTTDNYLPVVITDRAWKASLKNRVLPVRITGFGPEGLTGRAG